MIVLIPAYQPDARLVTLVGALRDAAPGVRVLVVDDGSGPAYRPVFAAAEALGCTFVGHAGNRGKGYALKAGFAYIARTWPGHDVVCADSDGQHSVVDVLRVAKQVRRTGRLVLGVRRFTGRVPLRSRFGNSVTRVLFAAATACHLPDTQTGLRGYPYQMLDWLTSVPGDRFEYEMNVLLQAAQSGRRVEVTDIATIYLDRNASSHFRPLVDSARVYAPLLRFSASSMLAFLVDAVGLLAMYTLTAALLPSAVFARLLSATVNFAVNRRLVFPGSRSGPVRYWLLAVTLLGANYAVLAALTSAGVGLLPAKLATDLALFAVSFLVQQRLVFARQVIPMAQTAHREPTGVAG